MDVRCSKCGTEYEFDDAKVKPTGVAVQCTTCGHVFKVKRDSGAVPEPVVVTDAKKNEDWMVRTGDDEVLRFKELTTLQKWIVEQRVHKSDKISKTGKNWKRLGEISELSSFFQVVEAANRASQSPVDANGLAPPSGAYEQPATSSPALPQAADDEEVVSASSLMHSGGYARPAMSVPADPNPQAVRRQPTIPPGSPTPPPVAPPPTASSELSTPPRDADAHVDPDVDPDPILTDNFGKAPYEVDLDDDDPVLQWQRRSRRRKLVVALLLVVIAVPVALYFAHRPTFDTVFGPIVALVEPPPPAIPDITKVIQSARADEIAALHTELPRHPSADAARARLLAELAWHNVEEARLAKALDAPAPEIDAPLAAAYDEAQRARKSTDATNAALANAAYQAARGGVSETRTELEGIDHPEVPVLHARARFSLAASEGTADAALASELVQLAKDRPDDARLAYLSIAARALGADAEAAAGLVPELEAFLEGSPGHEPASRLLELLKKSAPAAEGEGEARDEDPPADDPDSDDDDKPDAPELSYNQLLAKARAAQERGRASSALKLFRAAAKKNPRAAAPHVGIGWSYLDLDRARSALSAFKTAVARDPNSPDAQLGYAESLRYTGDKAAAIQAYKRFLELAPGSAEANMARNAIKALGG